VKPPPLRYVRPETLDEAAVLLAQAGEDGKILAGGQSLVPMLNFRLARPSVLIDVAALSELKGIARRDGMLEIGAAVRQREAERSTDVREACPLIAQALQYVGHIQTRSRGTVGGSLAHADPAAELPAVALALDGELEVVSARGTRMVAVGELVLGPYWTSLGDDEIVTRVRLHLPRGARSTLLEYARRSGDFAQAGVVVVVADDGGARVAAFGVGGKPVRLDAVEALIDGQELNEKLIDEAGRLAAVAVDTEDTHRRRLLGTLVRRALQEVRA
jgi:carbon-monoxide dehydrogenase medium subunit